VGYGEVGHVLRIAGLADCRNGRDGKVFVWQFGEKEEGGLDCGLPADEGIRQKPWLLHSLDVKEMTFCGIDMVVRDQVSSCFSISNRRKLSWLLPLEAWENSLTYRVCLRKKYIVLQ
jgi:hypothetical protein